MHEPARLLAAPADGPITRAYPIHRDPWIRLADVRYRLRMFREAADAYRTAADLGDAALTPVTIVELAYG